MFDVADSLREGLSRANGGLGSAATAAARAQTSVGKPLSDMAMARVAECAIFTEALLTAVHARLQEIKSVAK